MRFPAGGWMVGKIGDRKNGYSTADGKPFTGNNVAVILYRQK
jgi:hypothetical protein